MILVDIQVPQFDAVYDFAIDETAPLGEVIDRLLFLIQKETGSQKIGSCESYFLCNRDGSQIFSPKKCGMDYGIHSGNRLLLI